MRFLLLSIPFLLALSCSTPSQNDHGNDDQDQASQSDTSQESWDYVFDGKSLAGWRGFNAETAPDSWKIEDGLLTCDASGGAVGGDLIYAEQQFGNFEWEVEWKIETGGNSGLFYHGVEGKQYPHIYDNAPEYQLIDDIEFPEPLEPWQSVGADYAMYDPDSSKVIKPAGEWNSSRIVFSPEKVEHYLNGQLVVSFVPWSEDWYQRKAASKWKDHADYGEARKGYIGLQDHGHRIWFRSIRIREI